MSYRVIRRFRNAFNNRDRESFVLVTPIVCILIQRIVGPHSAVVTCRARSIGSLKSTAQRQIPYTHSCGINWIKSLDTSLVFQNEQFCVGNLLKRPGCDCIRSVNARVTASLFLISYHDRFYILAFNANANFHLSLRLFLSSF